MRLGRVSIGRFRALEGTELELGPGLVVVEGPNEAGKSTLLAFIQALLFPTALAAATRVEGSLDLHDADRAYRVIRSGARATHRLLDLASGDQLDLSRLAALTGSLDASTYRNVFAFGLGELQEFDGLTDAAVKERLFSAAVAGAGENAGRASRDLESRLGELLRPRSKETALGRPAEELRRLQAAATQARDEARAFERLERERDDAATLARTRADELGRTLAQRDWQANLLALWPAWQARAESLAALRRLGAAASEGGALGADERWLRHAATITELAAGLERYEQTLDEVARRLTAMQARVDALRDCLRELGPAWSAARLAAFDGGAAWRERAEAAQAEAQQAMAARARLAGAVEAAEHRLAEATAAEASARARREGLLAEAVRPAPAGAGQGGAAPVDDVADLRAVEARRAELERLEDLSVALSRAENERAGALERLQAASTRAASGRTARWVGWGLLIALAAGATWLAWGAGPGYGALALALGLAATALLAPARQRARGRDAMAALAEEAARLELVVGELAAESRTAAARLGLDGGATLAADLRAALRALALRSDALREARRARAAHDSTVAALRAAGEALEALRQEVASGKAVEADARREWEAWCERNGLPAGSGPSVVPHLLNAIERGRAAQSAYREAYAWVRPATLRNDDYRARAERLAGALGETVGEGGVASAVRGWVEALAGAEARRAERELERKRHEAVVRDAERELATRFGARQDAARRDLAAADPRGWEADVKVREEAAERLGQEVRGLDERVGGLKQRLDDLTHSADLATHQLAANLAAAEARAQARRWLVTSLAKGLIDETLGEYERTKVPAVLRRAGAHLASMTAGRYTRVHLQEGRALRVFTATDEPRETEELSRGTKEQLYLAVRFALIASFSESHGPLPLVLDDVLVNADPERAARLADVIADVALAHQVLFLTCHPHVARLLAERADAATHLRLAGPPREAPVGERRGRDAALPATAVAPWAGPGE